MRIRAQIPAALAVPIAATFHRASPRKRELPTGAPGNEEKDESWWLGSANQRLRRERSTHSFPSYPSGRGFATGRSYVAWLSSNDPCEDRFSINACEASDTVNGNFWTLFGVYDGHAGDVTSDALCDHLPRAVAHSIVTAWQDARTQGGHVDYIRTIKDAFLAIDTMIMHVALEKFQNAQARGCRADAMAIAGLAPAVAGSCALLAVYNARDRMLRVACTGDSRAVLGRYWSEQDRVLDGGYIDYDSLRPNAKPRKIKATVESEYTAIPLSVDQTGKNEAEIARLEAEHPNEPEMLKGLKEAGRLFGLAVTRAFGDHRWKWDNETVKAVQEEQFGPAVRPGAKSSSQPYLTAEPEVTEIRIGEANDLDSVRDSRGRSEEFLILASDGLWDHISDSDAVHLVVEWLKARRRRRGRSLEMSDEDEEREMEAASTGSGADGLARKGSLFQLKDGYAEWKYQRGWLVTEDDNAATHLIRNVLGGKNRGFFCGLLSTYPPMSRNVRDDITVQVVFFDDVD